jgi:hypothetical protein
MIDIRIEKLSVAHDPGSSHSAMNPGNASCTGASSKAALTPPNLKATHVVHVPIDAEMPCEGLNAATKLNTARLINEDIICTTEYNMMEEITEQMLN